MTGTLLLVVSATLGYIILCLRKNWLSDFSEICLLSLGSYIGQGMDLEHQKNLSSRVAIQSVLVCANVCSEINFATGFIHYSALLWDYPSSSLLCKTDFYFGKA